MTAQFSADEIIECTGGSLVAGKMPVSRGAICSDIDELKSGQWFIALPDQCDDGHDLLSVAHERGALGAIVIERRRYPFAHEDSTMIAVSSTLHAYYKLAATHCRQVDPRVIAITGSSGKSTTKDMCWSVASQSFIAYRSSDAKPDARSLAKTVLAMPEATEVLVVELSQAGRGQIAWLASGLDIDLGIITNIDFAHLETLGSIENIAAAKCELLESVDLSSGKAILGDDDERLMNRVDSVYATGSKQVFYDSLLDEIAVTPDATVFAVSDSDSLFEVKAHGNGYLRDAWCAIMTGRELGMSDPQIAEALKGYEPPRGRGNRLIARNNAILIDESYSASPASIRAAITAFLDERAVPRALKYIVLGGMEELGDASDRIHGEIGEWLSDKNFEALVTIGELAKGVAQGVGDANSFELVVCGSAEDAYAMLAPRLHENVAILVDGSDSADLRSLITNLTDSRSGYRPATGNPVEVEI